MVKPDFASAYQALRHDIGVLLAALHAHIILLPSQLSPPPEREASGQNCIPMTERDLPGCA